MGILDKKTRFIDLVVTQEGKRQIASGKLRAEFASLSDIGAFYSISDKDMISDRLYFEAMERPENSIVIEKDDSGKLLPFDFSPSGSIVGNNIFSGSLVSDVFQLLSVTGSQYSNMETQILSSSLKHFKNNRFLGSFDKPTDRDFELDNNDITFKITNTVPFAGGPLKERIHVNNAEPFFLDSKLTHLPNFQFLPPVNTDGSNYGSYEDPRSLTKETWEDIKKHLGENHFKTTTNIDNQKNTDLKSNLVGDYGNESRKLLINGQLPSVPQQKKGSKVINFKKSSNDNNIMIQFFEDSLGSTITKLDIVDAGIFVDNTDNQRRYEKRVFYVGKVFTDDYETPTFINIFTIVMD
jgi:hypothetical protein